MLNEITHLHLSTYPGLQSLDFQLPAELEAGEPPEARGLGRDQVRLMVSYYRSQSVLHSQFRRLPEFLQPGDLLVINTSGTLNAALNVRRASGQPLELHLSTHLSTGQWVVELRQPTLDGTLPFYTSVSGERLELPSEGAAILHTPYRDDQRQPGAADQQVRLWIASLHLPCTVHEYLACYGFPIRYKYVRDGWPISYYQTVYATEPGSAEMPSAGRAFTPELVTRLVAQGVQIAPLILHTGIASLEDHEPPCEEYYRIPKQTAQAVNAAHTDGRRVIAVGTTVVRALETVYDADGGIHSGEGYTRLIITPQRGLRVVNGLLTGLHEPRSTHLSMLQALVGTQHLYHTYAQALGRGYLWHEFGDLHLILP